MVNRINFGGRYSSYYLVGGGVLVVAFVLITWGFLLPSFVLHFTRTGTCDGENVCARVRALEREAVNLDIILVGNSAQLTVTPDATAAGDSVTPTDANFRVICSGLSFTTLVRATPADGVEVADDNAYLWFGELDGSGDPVLTPVPADGKLHAITGTFDGVGNHPTAMFVETADGRQRTQLEGFIYVDACL